MSHWDEIEKKLADTEGLAKFAPRLLGFNRFCQCGHEHGLHAGTPGEECVVLDCECSHYQDADK